LYKEIVNENFQRKITTPAEAINALTVGATHDDSYNMLNQPVRLNLLTTPNCPSPISRIGFGFNQSIKPEVFMPGGRKLFRKKPLQNDIRKISLKMEDQNQADGPGNKTAIPGLNGQINRLGFSCGTSNATALATRLGAQLLDILIQINEELGENDEIDVKYFSLLVKSLLIHGASLGTAKEIFAEILTSNQGIAANQIKKHISAYMGFGAINAQRILYCTDKRVTLLGFGKLKKDNAHIYDFPLPPSIGQKTIDKKLTITLIWLSPLNFKSNKYRQAHLYFDNVAGNGFLTLNREDYDFKAAQKGTSQHDVLAGNLADAFIDGDKLQIKVNCREDASGLGRQTEVRYAICVTLEVNENQTVEIYQEVKDRIQPRVRQMV